MAAKKKKMGRPKGSGAGLDVSVHVRLTPELADRVDAYAEPRDLERPEAIREILDEHLPKPK